MDKDKKLQALKERIAYTASKSKRLEDALKQRKPTPEIGDLYRFNIKGIPENVAIFWVIIDRHPDDPQLFFTATADTNPLIGSFDMLIPDSSLFGTLSLRLGRGQCLMESMFEPSLRVGMVEALFIERAQFMKSRIAKNEWIGSEMQQATDANPDYAEWIEVIDQAHSAMNTYLEQLIRVKAYSKVLAGIKVSVEKAHEWLIDVSAEGLRKLRDVLTPPILAPIFVRGMNGNKSVSEEDKINIKELWEKAPVLPIDFYTLRGKILQIDFLWIEPRPPIAPAVSVTLRGVAIAPKSVSWESWNSEIQVLKIQDCTILKNEQVQAKSLLRVRTADKVLYIDILPDQKKPK